MRRFRTRDKILDQVSMKLALLHDLKIREGLFDDAKGEVVFKAMLQAVNAQKLEQKKVLNIPKFKHVGPTERDELLFEICQRVYGFHRMVFFESLPASLWLEFLEHMEVLELDHDDIVYEKGSKADSFYVIRSGSVEFLMGDTVFDSMAFLQSRDWFGEIEIINQTRRKWSIRCKGKTSIYKIAVDYFFDLICFSPKLKRSFEDNTHAR